MTYHDSIDLPYNYLSSIPFWLVINTKEALHVSFPFAIQNLTSLTFLSVSKQFWFCSIQLGELKGLYYLNLSGNEVNHIEKSQASISWKTVVIFNTRFVKKHKIQGDDALLGYIQLNLSKNEFSMRLVNQISSLFCLLRSSSPLSKLVMLPVEYCTWVQNLVIAKNVVSFSFPVDQYLSLALPFGGSCLEENIWLHQHHIHMES